MKKITFALFLMISSFFIFANTTENVVLEHSAGRKVSLDYMKSGFNANETTVKISDKFGVVLYKESKSSALQLKKDFLIDKTIGEVFVVTIENELKSISTTFEMKGGAVSIAKDSEVLYKPMVNLKGNKVLLSLMNPTKKNVKVSLYDIDEKLIVDFSSTTQTLNKSIDLEAYLGDVINISVAVGVKTYYHSVELK